MVNKPILHSGLYTKDPNEVKKMVARIERFNITHIGNAIKLDIIPYEEGDEFVPVPHYKYRFLYPSRAIQAEFWTGNY